MKIDKLLKNLAEVFKILDFPQEKRDKLLAELLDGVFKLATAKTLEKHPKLVKKIKKLEEEKSTSEITEILTDPKRQLFNQSAQKTFTHELHQILDDYINQILPTVNTYKKQQILEIWQFSS